jgi:hypothetical protein
MKFFHGAAQEFPALGVQFAMGFQESVRHLGVGTALWLSGEAFVLEISRLEHSLANRLSCLGERPGDPVAIVLNLLYKPQQWGNFSGRCPLSASRCINPYRLFHGVWIPQWLEKRPEVSEEAKKLYAYLTYERGAGPLQRKIFERDGNTRTANFYRFWNERRSPF